MPRGDDTPPARELESDGFIDEWTVQDRHYFATTSTFTKRQLRPGERTLNRFGETAEHAFNYERLENERNALDFIAKNTTIPVPRVLNWCVDEDGVASLTLETINGRMVDHMMNGDELREEEKEILEGNVDSFLKDTVLPQLAELRSYQMGQLGGVLFPPPRIGGVPARPRTAYPPKFADSDCYVYCHNDLAQHNIVISPESLDVICLIDWEYSGFFPPGFEFPF